MFLVFKKAGILPTVGQPSYGSSAVDFGTVSPLCWPGGFVILAAVVTASIQDTPYFEEHYALNPVKADVRFDFRQCVDGEYYDLTATKSKCVECENSYLFFFYNNVRNLTNDKQYQCIPCPSGANSCYSKYLKLSPGYFRWAYDSTVVYECPMGAAACSGGTSTGQSLCKEGYEGPQCGVCKIGYYPTIDGKQCALCGASTFPLSQSIALAVGIFLILGLIVVMLLSFGDDFESESLVWKMLGSQARKANDNVDDQVQSSISDSNSRSRCQTFLLDSLYNLRSIVDTLPNIDEIIVKLKIFIASYQVVLQLPQNFKMRYPQNFLNYLGIFSFINFDVVRFVPIKCAHPTLSYIGQMYATTLLPIIGSVCLYIFYLLHAYSQFPEEFALEKFTNYFNSWYDFFSNADSKYKELKRKIDAARKAETRNLRGFEIRGIIREWIDNVKRVKEEEDPWSSWSLKDKRIKTSKVESETLCYPLFRPSDQNGGKVVNKTGYLISLSNLT